jgi:hypothetical protein
MPRLNLVALCTKRGSQHCFFSSAKFRPNGLYRLKRLRMMEFLHLLPTRKCFEVHCNATRCTHAAASAAIASQGHDPTTGLLIGSEVDKERDNFRASEHQKLSAVRVSDQGQNAWQSARTSHRFIIGLMGLDMKLSVRATS